MSLVKLYNLKKHLEGSWICDLGRWPLEIFT
jgi:hypothetical protein